MHKQAYKIPISVLVVIYTPQGKVLLIERADKAGFWQSVTGSVDNLEEDLWQTCAREVQEETGIQKPISAFENWHITRTYEIYPHWRHRYAEGVTTNTEHVFGLCVEESTPIQLSPREHTRFMWLPLAEAAQQCFSPSNSSAILYLKDKLPRV